MNIDILLKNMKINIDGVSYTLRLYDGSITMIKRVCKAESIALKEDLNIRNLKPIKGKHYLKFENKVYVIAEDINENSIIDYFELGRIIAKFHTRIKGIKLTEHKPYQNIQKKISDIGYYRDFLIFKSDKTIIDKLLIKIIELNEDYLEQSLIDMSNKKIINKIERDIKSKAVSHNDMVISRIDSDKSGRVRISSLDKMVNSVPIKDLADIISSAIHSDIYINDVKKIYDGYNEAKTLGTLDYKIFLALLMFPDNLYKILTNYVINDIEIYKDDLMSYMDYMKDKNKFIELLRRD